MANKTLVHVDTFVTQIERYYPEITFTQKEGFKAFISGQKAHYLETMDSFVPYLEDYLGKRITNN